MPNIAASLLLALASRRIKGGGVIVNEHTLNAAQTRLHVEVLARWFDFIRLEQLATRLDEPKERPFCLLTFDDGKRSNFTQTAPELERLGVPAVFYVTTQAVTTGSYLWFDVREQLVRALGFCPPGIDLATLKRLPLTLLLARLERAWRDYLPQKRLIAGCPEPGSNEPPASDEADGQDDLRLMSWDEVASLARRGFTIGAHGLSHAILTREPREQAFAEIEQSVAAVTSRIGAPCATFAWPNGNYNDELLEHALRCGVSTVMTTEPAWVDGGASLHRLPRIQLFGSSSRAHIESKIALAAFRGVLPNPNGSGRAYSFPPREAGRTSYGTREAQAPMRAV